MFFFARRANKRPRPQPKPSAGARRRPHLLVTVKGHLLKHQLVKSPKYLLYLTLLSSNVCIFEPGLNLISPKMWSLRSCSAALLIWCSEVNYSEAQHYCRNCTAVQNNAVHLSNSTCCATKFMDEWWPYRQRLDYGVLRKRQPLKCYIYVRKIIFL